MKDHEKVQLKLSEIATQKNEKVHWAETIIAIFILVVGLSLIIFYPELN